MRNKQKSINRQIKRKHIIVVPEVVTREVIDRWETNVILGGVEPVWKTETTIVPHFYKRTSRGHLLAM